MSKNRISKIRFPLSCSRHTSRRPKLTDVPVDGSVLARVPTAAESVFVASAVVFPDVAETLRALSAERRVVLFTQGDRDVQFHRITTSGLRPWFTRIEVVRKSVTRPFKLSSTHWAQIPHRPGWLGTAYVRTSIRPAAAG